MTGNSMKLVQEKQTNFFYNITTMPLLSLQCTRAHSSLARQYTESCVTTQLKYKKFIKPLYHRKAQNFSRRAKDDSQKTERADM